MLTEQRPRMQSQVEVVSLLQGDAVIFSVNLRPVNGARRLRSGLRHTLGIIFHDAT